MRTLRLSLLVTVILTLLGGMSGAVLGQDEEADPMAPATVTGSVRYIGGRQSGEILPGDETVRQSGMRSNHAWEASDPRLIGRETYTKTVDYYPPLGFYVDATSRVLENDAGRWVGTGVGMEGVFIDTGTPLLSTATVILHGEEAYEGLTAYLLMDEGASGSATFTGVIFPGEMPPFPEAAD